MNESGDFLKYIARTVTFGNIGKIKMLIVFRFRLYQVIYDLEFEILESLKPQAAAETDNGGRRRVGFLRQIINGHV